MQHAEDVAPTFREIMASAVQELLLSPDPRLRGRGRFLDQVMGSFADYWDDEGVRHSGPDACFVLADALVTVLTYAIDGIASCRDPKEFIKIVDTILMHAALDARICVGHPPEFSHIRHLAAKLDAGEAV